MPKKRRLAYLLAALLLLMSTAYGVLAYRKPVGALSGSVMTVDTPSASSVHINWPRSGQSAVGGLDEGVLAVSSESQAQQPIASITKVITALVVLDKQPIAVGEQGPSYVIGQSDIESYHAYVAVLGSVMPVSNGQSLTLYQALQGLMLRSGNNIADSLARWVFGSMDSYVTAANQYLVQHGLDKTVVGDASGFSPASMSTPTDLIRLGQLALQNPILEEIVNQRQADIPGSGIIQNTNFLLRGSEDAIGIKTGTTDEAGYCLLFAIKHGPQKDDVLLGAVLGQRSWSELYAQVESIRDQALENYKQLEIAPAGTIVGEYRTPWGGVSQVVTLDPVSVYAWAGTEHRLNVVLNAIDVPEPTGVVTGVATLERDEGAQTKVILRQSVEPPGLLWRLRNYW